MIRPITGRTPNKVRQAKALQLLRESGGDKVAAFLPAESVANLNTIIAANGFAVAGSPARKGRTEAIIWALAVGAKACARSRAKAAAKTSK